MNETTATTTAVVTAVVVSTSSAHHQTSKHHFNKASKEQQTINKQHGIATMALVHLQLCGHMCCCCCHTSVARATVNMNDTHII
jgi:LDH2 family malate/lactate/ureidoglycolate dehydrogenase